MEIQAMYTKPDVGQYEVETYADDLAALVSKNSDRYYWVDSTEDKDSRSATVKHCSQYLMWCKSYSSTDVLTVSYIRRTGQMNIYSYNPRIDEKTIKNLVDLIDSARSTLAGKVSSSRQLRNDMDRKVNDSINAKSTVDEDRLERAKAARSR